MRAVRFIAPIAIAAVLLSSSQGAQTIAAETSDVVQLGRYHVDPAKVFVAGISSGGAFAVQMHVAHSATFRGAAIYAGGVYYCAHDSIQIALADCGGNGLYASRLRKSEAYLDLDSKLGRIDPEANLAGHPVYLWSGTHDTVVNPKAMDDLQSEYEHYGARPIRFDARFPAEHGWESPDGRLRCGTLREPYMIVCDRGSRPYDSEHAWLTMFLGRLAPRNNGRLRGRLLQFDQTEFGASAANSMDKTGWIFVPRSCARGDRCALVVAFHGCKQTQSDIGNTFAKESGINPWADRNHLIVLYPYAMHSSAAPRNPKGCWDWWGYSGAGYALKSGAQITVVFGMVRRLMRG